jgi:deoxyribonuclease V
MLPIMRPPKFDLRELSRIQDEVAKQVKQVDCIDKFETVAGCDVSFAEGDMAYAACALLNYKDLRLLDSKVRRVKLRFPYIPTYLAFRELEGILGVVEGMEADAFMVGAHGLAHPRRAGLACHLGVAIDKPVLGVAKAKLHGEAKTPADIMGSCELLKVGDEVVGAVVRTKTGTKPVYVSVGHKLTLKTAIKIALETTRGHRMPEPVRVAHMLATKAMLNMK